MITVCWTYEESMKLKYAWLNRKVWDSVKLFDETYASILNKSIKEVRRKRLQLGYCAKTARRK